MCDVWRNMKSVQHEIVTPVKDPAEACHRCRGAEHADVQQAIRATRTRSSSLMSSQKYLRILEGFKPEQSTRLNFCKGRCGQHTGSIPTFCLAAVQAFEEDVEDVFWTLKDGPSHAYTVRVANHRPATAFGISELWSPPDFHATVEAPGNGPVMVGGSRATGGVASSATTAASRRASTAAGSVQSSFHTAGGGGGSDGSGSARSSDGGGSQPELPASVTMRRQLTTWASRKPSSGSFAAAKYGQLVHTPSEQRRELCVGPPQGAAPGAPTGSP
eukprot:292955-Chlamydomonas_euryale.AAC.1